MKYLYILFLPILSLLTACSSSDVPGDVATGENVSVSFSLITAGKVTDTRTDNQGHLETDSEFRDFEDGIDMEDLGIFIFAKIAGSTSEEKLVYKFTNLLDSDPGRISIVGPAGNYLVNLMIRKDELYDVLDEYAITPEGKAIISFRILILANCLPASATATSMWDAVDGSTFSSVISQLEEWNFPMTDLYNADGGAGVAAIYNKKKHCPMFGTNVSSVTEDALYYSRPEDRVYLGEVNLLRALSKVRVVDNIQNKDALGYPKITAAEFLSSQNQARQVPAGAANNYEDGQQVHTPNIFDVNSNLTLEGTYKLGILPDSWTITPADMRTGYVFIGFVPEQKIGHPNNNIEEGMPQFHITVACHKADDTFEDLDYYVPMTSYNGVNFNFGQNILRNHIYTLSVNDFGATLNLEVDVVPYRSCVLEPYFGLDRD